MQIQSNKTLIQMNQQSYCIREEIICRFFRRANWGRDRIWSLHNWIWSSLCARAVGNSHRTITFPNHDGRHDEYLLVKLYWCILAMYVNAGSWFIWWWGRRSTLWVRMDEICYHDFSRFDPFVYHVVYHLPLGIWIFLSVWVSSRRHFIRLWNVILAKTKRLDKWWGFNTVSRQQWCWTKLGHGCDFHSWHECLVIQSTTFIILSPWFGTHLTHFFYYFVFNNPFHKSRCIHCSHSFLKLIKIKLL